jgi:putative glycosyltransferase
MKLSIVTTMYHSASHLLEFYDRMKKEADAITPDHEIIFVNDGSPDSSLDVALSIGRKDDKVCVVDLSRNFGHHKAIMTGLSYAGGEKVFLIDCDLEEEPELLGLFYKKLADEGCDVVYGVQKGRKGGLFERLSGELFYSVLNYLSNEEFPRNAVTARLMSGRYVKSLLEHGEREIFIDGLWQLTGYRQMPVPVVKHSKSETTYSLRKKLALFINAITSFSDRPLIYIFYTGSAISLIAALYIVLLLVRKVLFGITVGGWTSLIVSVWFLGGLTIFFLGVIGIYLSKVFIETKKRPYTVVRGVYKGSMQNDE